MSSIAAIDPRCFVSPPAMPAQPTPRTLQEDRAPRWNASFVMTWRPPLERAKTRLQEGR
jgi:hypothetical protein